MLHINFGLLASYTAGNYLPYYLIPKIMLCLPIAFLAMVCLLPETPYCLLRKGKVVEAEKSLMFYRNIPDVTRKTLAFEYEFESLKTFTLSEVNKEKLSLADFSEFDFELQTVHNKDNFHIPQIFFNSMQLDLALDNLEEST